MAIAFDVLRGGREVCRQGPAGRAEYKSRLALMVERQIGLCAICGKAMDSDVSFDHELGRGMGGGKRDDRIEIDGVRHNAAAHILCNRLKGSRRVEYVVQ